MKVDPVCEAEVAEIDETAKLEYEGTLYYFCSTACQAAFRQNPQKYLEKEDE